MGTPTLQTTVWLYGSPVFSLVYLDLVGGQPFERHTDLGGFRPCVTDHLEEGKKYMATLYFEYQIAPDGTKIRRLKSMDISTQKFVYVR
jgi:hypothetical protein